MNTLRIIWFVLGIILFPIRYLLYTTHRLLVFSSKSGARWIVPMLMLAFGILLRSKIDAVAGEAVTEFFWEFRDPDFPHIFDYRMELVFAGTFFTAFIGLTVVSKVTTPIVGAIPAPQRPLAPLRPITVTEHTVETVKAKVSVKPPRLGFHNGKLARLDKRLPAAARSVLVASANAERAAGRQSKAEAKGAAKARKAAARQQAAQAEAAKKAAKQAKRDEVRQRAEAKVQAKVDRKEAERQAKHDRELARRRQAEEKRRQKGRRSKGGAAAADPALDPLQEPLQRPGALSDPSRAAEAPRERSGVQPHPSQRESNGAREAPMRPAPADAELAPVREPPRTQSAPPQRRPGGPPRPPVIRNADESAPPSKPRHRQGGAPPRPQAPVRPTDTARQQPPRPPRQGPAQDR